jgi:hypothetical protein
MARLYVAYEEQGEQSPLAGAGDALLDAQARARDIREKEEERRLADRQIRVSERRNELTAEANRAARQDTLFERKYRTQRDKLEDERYAAEQERQTGLDEAEQRDRTKALGIQEEEARTKRMAEERLARQQEARAGETQRAKKSQDAIINTGKSKLQDRVKSTAQHLRPSQSWMDERQQAIESAIVQYNEAAEAGADPDELRRLAGTVATMQAEALDDFDDLVEQSRSQIINEELGDLLAIAQDPELAIPGDLVAKAQDAKTPQAQRDNLRVLVEEWRGWRATEREWQEKAPAFSGQLGGAPGFRAPAGESPVIGLARDDYWKVMGGSNSTAAEKARAARHFLKVLTADGDTLRMTEASMEIDRGIREERIAQIEEQAFFGEIFASTAPSLNTTFMAAGALADEEFYPEPGTPEYDEFVQHAPAANLVLSVIEDTFGDSAAAMPESDVMRLLAKRVMSGEGEASLGGGEGGMEVTDQVTREDLRAFFAYINDNRTNAEHPLWRSIQDVDTSLEGAPERPSGSER